MSPVEWRYLARAAYELLQARVRFAMTSPGKIIKSFPEPSEAPSDVAASNVVDLALMSWAIVAVSQRVPWRSDCLLRAMAADQWLRRYGLRGEFYLGVANDPRGTFSAHAWLRCGGLTIAGGATDGFTALIGHR